MNGIPKSTRRALLIAAAVIFAAAMIWLAVLESHSYTRAVCRRINEFGYHIAPADLYSRGYGRNTSISSVVDEDLTEAKEISSNCGFDAETEKTGLVELMLYNDQKTGKVMYIWLLDREPQLVFLEDMESGELSPIGS